MARIIESTEEHGLDRIGPARHQAPHDGWRRHGRRRRDRRAARREVPRHVHPVRRLGQAAVADPPQLPMLAFTPDAATRSQLALAWGIETFLVPMARHTDQMAPPGRRVAARLRSAASGGRPRRHRRRLASRHPRLDQRAARPPDGRRGQQGRARLRGARRSHHRVLTRRLSGPYVPTGGDVRAGTDPGAARWVCFRRTLPGWWNGRHGALKMLCPKGRAGSSPALGTKTWVL